MGNTAKNGFSLLEVMLVTLMIAILASAGWPTLQRTMQQQQLMSAAELVYLAVRDARLAAIGNGADWWFGKTASAELCFSDHAVIPAQCSPPHAAESSVIALQKLPEQIHVDVHFHANQAVRFSAHTGMAGFSAGHFAVRHQELADTTVKIIVSSIGRIRMCIEGARNSRVPPC
ncbi:pilus assembly FimT family protein [Aliidiomarina sp.]|uniref:pilus assembly FimT family protein n=1 Tax=Aliidiomarina sp. TaxID=1872439 RepID=UPI003A4DD580